MNKKRYKDYLKREIERYDRYLKKAKGTRDEWTVIGIKRGLEIALEELREPIYITVIVGNNGNEWIAGSFTNRLDAEKCADCHRNDPRKLYGAYVKVAHVYNSFSDWSKDNEEGQLNETSKNDN